MPPSIMFTDQQFAQYTDRVDGDAPLPRLCYAAAHVVLQESYSDVEHTPEAPGSSLEIAAHVDWEATMGLRKGIGATGMGIAEAMDTAQRFSLGWESARTLIEHTGKLELPGGFCAGASTDHCPSVKTTSDLIDGVCEQVELIQAAGGIPVVLPMPLLPALATNASGYVKVYGEIARNCGAGPLFVHWLGPMFLPSLEGYFPEDSFQQVMRNNPDVYRGAKLSLLDASLERSLRDELLTNDQILLTGDDFHFGELIAGEGEPLRTTTINNHAVPLGQFSHALLGVFDAIAAPAALALRLLDTGDRAAYGEIMTRCEALGQCVFEEPTHLYKVGLAFLAWLNGLQSNWMLINHVQSAREHDYLIRVAHLANEAGAITDAQRAQERFDTWRSQNT